MSSGSPVSELYPGRMVPPYTISAGRLRRAIAIRHPGMFLSQPGSDTLASYLQHSDVAVWWCSKEAHVSATQEAQLVLLALLRQHMMTTRAPSAFTKMTSFDEPFEIMQFDTGTSAARL